MNKLYPKLIYHKLGVNPLKLVRKSTKRLKRFQIYFLQKKTRLDVAIVDTNYFIKNTNLLLLHCPLSYNMKVETQTHEESVCYEVLKCIINNVEETMNLDFYNSYMNTIITKQKLLKNNCYLGNQTCYFPLDFKLPEFFFKHIIVSEENMKYIFNKTLDQSGKFWLDNRKVRISASNKAHKIKTSKTLSDEKQQALAKSIFSSKPLIGKAAINATYGTQTENEAFVSYCKMVNLPIIKCGLVIHLEKPWLCATPDGIVIVNDKPEKVLEIKCPISCKDKEIIDPLTNIPNINYLKVIDGKVCLKESHMYYTQCQVLMFTTGLNSCDLYIYNCIKPLLLTVNKNEHFLLNTINKLESFYYTFYLPVCAC